MADGSRTAAVEARIDHIAELMRSLKWRRGDTYKELAKEWALSEQYLRELAAEASRRVRAEITDPDRVTASVGVALEIALEGAVGDRDWKGVAQVARTWSEIAGAGIKTAPSPTGSLEQQISMTESVLEALKSQKEGQGDE